MHLSDKLRGLLLVGLATAVAPVGIATAAVVATGSANASKAAPSRKAKARKLCRTATRSPAHHANVKRAATLAVPKREVNRVSSELCTFYAMPTAAKIKFWNTTIKRAAKAKLITRRDAKVLSAGLKNPREMMVAWRPETAFGVQLQDAFNQGSSNDNDTQASTAGDVGTILGGMIGGLGGTPMSVGIGAAAGKVLGEAANALGNYWYDLAPDDGDGIGEEGGGEEGGGEGGGGEGGGGEGGGD